MHKLLMSNHNPPTLENKPFQRQKCATPWAARPRLRHTPGGTRGGGGGGKTTRAGYILVSPSLATFVIFFHKNAKIGYDKKSRVVSRFAGLVSIDLQKMGVFRDNLSTWV